jgi:hypothetical protein
MMLSLSTWALFALAAVLEIARCLGVLRSAPVSDGLALNPSRRFRPFD